MSTTSSRPQAAARTPLAKSPGRELSALLWPISPETFVREYWGKKPLFVKGFPDKYLGVFDRQAFLDALSAPGPAPDDFLHASFDKGRDARDPGEWASVSFTASPEEAMPLFKAGATLCVTLIETRAPALAPLVASVKRQLGYPGNVHFNAYLSPPGVGFNWHFDGRIASTLQIEGTKRWRFSNRPAVPWPRSNGALRADGTGEYTDPLVQRLESIGFWQAGKEYHGIPFDEKDTTEVVLEPGDLLVLPAGVWHDACAGDAGSLALNLSFSAVSYTLLARNLLDALLTPDPGWRAPPPLLPVPGAAPGEVDPSAMAEVTAQLTAAADALRSLAGDSAAVVRLWSSFVQNPNPGFPVPPSLPAASPTPVTPDQRLRVRADGNYYARLADGGSRLYVAVGTSGAVEVIGEAVAFVQRLLAVGEFAARDCLRWSDEGTLDWADVEAMLTKLKNDGLIESADDAAFSAIR